MICHSHAPISSSPPATTQEKPPAESIEASKLPISFLTDIDAIITKLLGQGMVPSEIIQHVHNEIRVDQCVTCLQRTSKGDIISINSRSNNDGIVTNPSELRNYTNFFNASQDAIDQYNKSTPKNSPSKRPPNILVQTFQLQSDSGIQTFQANISILDQDHICFARFLIPSANQITPPPNPVPPHATSFKDSVAVKINTELLTPNATPATVQASVVNKVEVEDAVICVAKLTDGSYFRLHTRSANDGIITNPDEVKIYDGFFAAINQAIAITNPIQGMSFIRPQNLKPMTYELRSEASGNIETFNMYPFVIDENHVCFGRMLQSSATALAQKDPNDPSAQQSPDQTQSNSNTAEPSAMPPVLPNPSEQVPQIQPPHPMSPQLPMMTH